MTTLKIAINGPILDPDAGVICTVDIMDYSPDREAFNKSYIVKTGNVIDALDSVKENINVILLQK